MLGLLKKLGSGNWVGIGNSSTSGGWFRTLVNSPVEVGKYPILYRRILAPSMQVVGWEWDF